MYSSKSVHRKHRRTANVFDDQNNLTIGLRNNPITVNMQ